jgi:hypothetical protein
LDLLLGDRLPEVDQSRHHQARSLEVTGSTPVPLRQAETLFDPGAKASTSKPEGGGRMSIGCRFVAAVAKRVLRDGPYATRGPWAAIAAACGGNTNERHAVRDVFLADKDQTAQEIDQAARRRAGELGLEVNLL